MGKRYRRQSRATPNRGCDKHPKGKLLVCETIPGMAEMISVRRLNWYEWPRFAPTWERIHNLCPNASFFLSREWVDCWLATFGEDLNPDLLAFERDGHV